MRQPVTHRRWGRLLEQQEKRNAEHAHETGRSKCTSTVTTSHRISKARRKRPRGSFSTGMEARLLRATRPRLRCVAGALRRAPPAGALGPAIGRIRTRKRRIDRVSAVAVGACLSARADAGLRRELARELQGLPAAAETRELQPRSGDAKDRRIGRCQPLTGEREPGPAIGLNQSIVSNVCGAR
jgi:hypothetical protein